MSLLNTILESTEVLQSSVLYRVFNNSVFAGFVFRNIWRILDSRVSLESWKEGASAYVLCSYLFDFFGYFRVMGLHSIVLFFSTSKITYK